MTKLYHRNVFWKEEFDCLYKELITENMKLTNHVLDHLYIDTKRSYAINDKRFKRIVKSLSELDIKPFEVEETDGKITKCVIRLPYSNKNDICLVIRKGTIITAWLNNKFDEHDGLRKFKYDYE